MVYDTAIIGTGPAGISASVYLARASRSVIAVGKDSGALEKAESIENYYGFDEPIGGAELAARGIKQAERLGVAVAREEIVSLSVEDAFVLKTSGGNEYRARTVLIATGKQRSALRVSGFEEYRGKGISFCATCDGFFYRGKKIAIVGSGDYCASEYGELLHYTKDVTVFTDGAVALSARFPHALEPVVGKIVSFAGSAGESGRLEKIITMGSDGKQHAHEVAGAFIAIGTAGAADFAAKVGIEVNGTDIVVDGEYRTNVPGIFAAGDCVGGFLQVAKAVSDGALASKSIVSHLKSSRSDS